MEDRDDPRAGPVDDDDRGRARAARGGAWSAPRSPSPCTCGRRRGAALYPLVVGSQALPIVVLAAPLILLLGFGLAPKIVIVALVCFFPVTVNLYDGLRAVDPEQRKLLRSLHALAPRRR